MFVLREYVICFFDIFFLAKDYSIQLARLVQFSLIHYKHLNTEMLLYSNKYCDILVVLWVRYLDMPENPTKKNYDEE